MSVALPCCFADHLAKRCQPCHLPKSMYGGEVCSMIASPRNRLSRQRQVHGYLFGPDVRHISYRGVRKVLRNIKNHLHYETFLGCRRSVNPRTGLAPDLDARFGHMKSDMKSDMPHGITLRPCLPLVQGTAKGDLGGLHELG